MVIYLVQGNTGEYEDYQEWIAKAFLDKDKAEAFMQKCIEYANYMQEDAMDEDGMYYPRWMFVDYTSPDKRFTMDYTGTFYELVEIEVEE